MESSGSLGMRAVVISPRAAGGCERGRLWRGCVGRGAHGLDVGGRALDQLDHPNSLTTSPWAPLTHGRGEPCVLHVNDVNLRVLEDILVRD